MKKEFITRRKFLQKTAHWTAAGMLPLSCKGFAQSEPNRPNVFVSISLRGGADALSICAPYKDPNYIQSRNNTLLTESQVIDLDGFFGLNKQFSGLDELFFDGHLNFLHCCGSTSTSRSHFTAMDHIDTADPTGATTSGWLQRAITELNDSASNLGISMGNKISPLFFGETDSTAIASVQELKNTRITISSLDLPLREMYCIGNNIPLCENSMHIPEVLSSGTRVGLDSLTTFSNLDTTPGATYIDHPFGRTMQEVASLIRSNIGVQFIAVDIGGWDHHADQYSKMNSLGAVVGSVLKSFRNDLQGSGDFDRTVALCSTEFGRTVAENGSAGTDHGHGSLMMTLGGRLVNASGGQVLLADGVSTATIDGVSVPNGWMGLARDVIQNGRYLPVTTDFRDAFAEVMKTHMGFNEAQLGYIIPGRSNFKYPGLLT